MEKLMSIFYITDTKEIEVFDGKGEYEKIYLELEKQSYTLEEFKEYILFIFNDKIKILKSDCFEDIIERIQELHPDFLSKDSDYFIMDCVLKTNIIKEFGAFLSRQDAENTLKLNDSKLKNPKIVELKINEEELKKLHNGEIEFSV